MNDSSGDSDLDELTNLEEYLNNCDPHSSDTDSDLMPDGWEVTYGLDPSSDDASADLDSDGLTNYEEYQINTNPNNEDTENDGMHDGWEVQNGLNPLVVDDGKLVMDSIR